MPVQVPINFLVHRLIIYRHNSYLSFTEELGVLVRTVGFVTRVGGRLWKGWEGSQGVSGGVLGEPWNAPFFFSDVNSSMF